MKPNDELQKKLTQQYKLAELKRRILIRELYNLIDELENRPRIQIPYPFPYNGLARAINSFLNLIERKILRKHWAKRRT